MTLPDDPYGVGASVVPTSPVTRKYDLGGALRISHLLLYGPPTVPTGDPRPDNTKMDGVCDVWGRQYVISQAPDEVAYPTITQATTRGVPLSASVVSAVAPLRLITIFGASHSAARVWVQLINSAAASSDPALIVTSFPVPVDGTFSLDTPLLFTTGLFVRIADSPTGTVVVAPGVSFTALYRLANL